MGVIKIQEIHDGRDGSADHTTKVLHKYSRHWRVWTSSVYDGAYTVLAACPVVPAQLHPDDPIAVAGVARCENDRKAKKVWYLHVDYSSEGAQPSQPKQLNPTSDAAVITWNTDTSQANFDRDSNGKLYLNSAGDLFATNIKDDLSTWTIEIVKNCTSVPWWIGTYRDAVNEDTVTIDGVTFSPGQLKIKSIKIGKWEMRNQVWYREVQFQIKVKDAPPPGVKHGDFTNIAGNDWRHYLVDQGMKQKDPDDDTLRIPCVDGTGKTAKTPQLLDGQGVQLENPTPNNTKYLCVNIRNPKPFNQLPLY
jgi:hypothetical protein